MLLNTVRDYFHFVTKFFEPISHSATHIYHSALELSPLSSIIRRLYYNQRCTSFPRVVAGTTDSWNQGINISSGGAPYRFFTWSPCGQFVAASCGGTIEIRDPLSSELLSTLSKAGVYIIDELAYSPDGHSLASCSNTGLIIWDIQTGGLAKGIGYSSTYKSETSLVWSLDGSTISAITDLPDQGIILYTGTSYAVHIYEIASGTTWSPGTLKSRDTPYLWAHDKSFRVMATGADNKSFTVIIYEVGSTLTKVKSFQMKLLDDLVGPLGSSIWGENPGIKSFSPTTHQISALVHHQLQVLDIQNSMCMLEQKGDFRSHCFSSDGSLFAASLSDKVNIWKCTSGCYSLWKVFPTKNFHGSPLQFSPTSSSALHHSWNSLQVWQLDGPPLVTPSGSCTPLAVLSHCGTYMVTGYEENSTITVTSPLSQTTLQLINTGIKVEGLALTGNVLLVQGSGVIVAWLLTEEGIVDSVLVDKMADYSSSIWTVSSCDFPGCFAREQVMTMDWEERVHAYHMGTGVVLEPLQVPPHYHYAAGDVKYGRHYPHYHDLDKCSSEGGWPISHTTLRGGWIKDTEGKHQLWVPVEWRMPMYGSTGWLSNLTTLWLDCQGRTIIIMF